MTLSEEECVRKWTEVEECLANVAQEIALLTRKLSQTDKEDQRETARIHALAALVMTQLENGNDPLCSGQ